MSHQHSTEVYQQPCLPVCPSSFAAWSLAMMKAREAFKILLQLVTIVLLLGVTPFSLRAASEAGHPGDPRPGTTFQYC